MGGRGAYRSKSRKQKNIFRISLQFFGKKSSDYATVFLPKDEYALVMSEIATNLTKEQKNQKVFKKYISDYKYGDHEYTIENNGFGNYRIIGKKRMK